MCNQSPEAMEELKNIKRPSKEEQTAAFESYNALEAVLKEIRDKSPEIEIEETKDKIRIPLKALKLLAKILKAMGEGKPISVVPIAAEMTTQAAAEFLNCSRPHFVKLLEEGEIPFTKIGKHRRVKFEDVSNYKDRMKKEQEDLIIQMMKSDEESGLYDS
jgi:excisionase family DNA binding protein